MRFTESNKKFVLNLTEADKNNYLKLDSAKKTLEKYYKTFASENSSEEKAKVDQKNALFDKINKFPTILSGMTSLDARRDKLKEMLDDLKNSWEEPTKISASQPNRDQKYYFEYQQNYKQASLLFSELSNRLSVWKDDTIDKKKNKKEFSEKFNSLCQLTLNMIKDLIYKPADNSTVDFKKSLNVINLMLALLNPSNSHESELNAGQVDSIVQKAEDAASKINKKEEFLSAIKTLGSYNSQVIAWAKQFDIDIDLGNSSIKNNTNWLDLFKKSSNKDAFWIRYFNEYWGKNQDFVKKIGGKAFKIECEEFGFDETSNLFISFIKEFLLKNEIKIDAQHYAVIHNYFANNRVDIKSELNEKSNRRNLLLFNPATYSLSYSDLEQYLNWYYQLETRLSNDAFIQTFNNEFKTTASNEREVLEEIFFGENGLNSLSSADWIRQRIMFVLDSSNIDTFKLSNSDRNRVETSLCNTLDKELIRGFFTSYNLYRGVVSDGSDAYNKNKDAFLQAFNGQDSVKSTLSGSDLYLDFEANKRFWNEIFRTSSVPNPTDPASANNVYSNLGTLLSNILARHKKTA